MTAPAKDRGDYFPLNLIFEELSHSVSEGKALPERARALGVLLPAAVGRAREESRRRSIDQLRHCGESAARPPPS